MNTRLLGALGTGICVIASATFAGAVGFAAVVLLQGSAAQPQLGITAAIAAAIALLLSSLAIKAAAVPTSSFRPIAFNVAEFEPFEADVSSPSDDAEFATVELVLTDAERISAQAPAPEPLILDDVLAELEPDSRVVRLFDRKAMPTPGQLQLRIDDHLGQRNSQAAPDAAQALADALAELRRSLR